MSLGYEKRETWRDPLMRRVSWIVHGKAVSVEFWIQVGTAPLFGAHEFKGEPCWPGGFELHSRSGEGEPSGVDCSVLGGNCWHDGSSLAASEFFETWQRDDASAFAECELWLRETEEDAEEAL